MIYHNPWQRRLNQWKPELLEAFLKLVGWQEELIVEVNGSQTLQEKSCVPRSMAMAFYLVLNEVLPHGTPFDLIRSSPYQFEDDPEDFVGPWEAESNSDALTVSSRSTASSTKRAIAAAEGRVPSDLDSSLETITSADPQAHELDLSQESIQTVSDGTSVSIQTISDRTQESIQTISDETPISIQTVSDGTRESIQTVSDESIQTVSDGTPADRTEESIQTISDDQEEEGGATGGQKRPRSPGGEDEDQGQNTPKAMRKE